MARLLRLSLFQVSTGMTLVLLVGTLNRVMIVELGVPASLVGVMIALPVVFAPFRALIGFKSDVHRSALGWRRVPFIWKGSLWQFGGFAIMPFALLVLAGRGEAGNAPIWVGHGGAALAFLWVGIGVHTVQTVGLALVTDLAPEESHPKVVGLMYVMLLLGMIASALFFGWALSDFSEGRLVQVIQFAAVMVLVLNVTAIWKQETRVRGRDKPTAVPDPTLQESWATLKQGGQFIRRLVVVGVGTMAFGMADILLEPFGGQVLEMTVSATTRLTALFAFGGLVGFAVASSVAGRGADAHRVAQVGAVIGIPAFAMVLLAEPLGTTELFLGGNFLIGFGGALFSHGTLTAAMNLAPPKQAGLSLGAWGAVQATAAGLAVAVSSALRDVVTAAVGPEAEIQGIGGVAFGYASVYALEIGILLVTIVAVYPLIRSARSSGSDREVEAHTPAADVRPLGAGLRIREYPDPILRTHALPVTDFDGEFQTFVDDLLETLYASGGIGLSAPQVGDRRAVMVMDLSDDHSEPQVLVNPEILEDSRPAWVEESCLSLPGLEGKVIRATRLRVQALDRSGAPVEVDLEDMYAVCVQHEVDHLQGRLFIDRLPVLKRWWTFAGLRAKHGRVPAPVPLGDPVPETT